LWHETLNFTGTQLCETGTEESIVVMYGADVNDYSLQTENDA